jgi:hypothetical protein
MIGSGAGLSREFGGGPGPVSVQRRPVARARRVGPDPGSGSYSGRGRGRRPGACRPPTPGRAAPMTLRPPLSERTRRHVFARRAAIKPRMAAERPATPSLALRAWLTKAAVSARQPDPEHDRQASDLVFQTEPTLVRVDFLVVRFSDLLKRSPHTEGDDQANENRRNRRNRQNDRPEQCQTKMLRRVLCGRLEPWATRSDISTARQKSSAWS